MCKAVEEYANKARQEGILETIVSLVHDGLLSVTEAAKRTSLSAGRSHGRTSGRCLGDDSILGTRRTAFCNRSCQENLLVC